MKSKYSIVVVFINHPYAKGGQDALIEWVQRQLSHFAGWIVAICIGNYIDRLAYCSIMGVKVVSARTVNITACKSVTLLNLRGRK